MWTRPSKVMKWDRHADADGLVGELGLDEFLGVGSEGILGNNDLGARVELKHGSQASSEAVTSFEGFDQDREVVHGADSAQGDNRDDLAIVAS